MRQEMQKLANLATSFERSGNVAAGQIVTEAMRKIAQTPTLAPATVATPGAKPGAADQNLENMLGLMIQRAANGTDPRAKMLLMEAAQKYTGTGFKGQAISKDIALGQTPYSGPQMTAGPAPATTPASSPIGLGSGASGPVPVGR